MIIVYIRLVFHFDLKVTGLTRLRIKVKAVLLKPNLHTRVLDKTQSYLKSQADTTVIRVGLVHNICPIIWPTYVKENGTTRVKTYEELSVTEKLQADCDVRAANLVLQGLPPDVYSLVNHHRVAKDIWDRVKLLMQVTSLSKQDRECKLYDEFDKFAHVKGETLHQYYLSLISEWSKFITDVKLAMDLHTTNYDQLHAYLQQHELHA
ncbi:hypothetical protein Tco_0743008 [Tanacetum coccineum]